MPGKKKSKTKVKKNTSSEGTKTRVTPTFRANIEKVKEYAKHHGEIPTYQCKDEEGIQVYRFLRKSKEHFKKGTLTDEAIGLLDSINGFSISSGRLTLKEMVNKCKEFVETNQRLPRDFVRCGDKSEANLCNFFANHKVRQGSLVKSRRVREQTELKTLLNLALQTAIRFGLSTRFTKGKLHAKLKQRLAQNSRHSRALRRKPVLKST